jgi:hypothetical protein
VTKLLYFLTIWYIFPILVCCTENNLATLVRSKKTSLATFDVKPSL